VQARKQAGQFVNRRLQIHRNTREAHVQAAFGKSGSFFGPFLENCTIEISRAL